MHTNIVPCKNNYDANSRLCIFGTEYIMCRLLRSAVSIKNSPWRIILFYLRSTEIGKFILIAHATLELKLVKG